jgi:hypothetical protein
MSRRYIGEVSIAAWVCLCRGVGFTHGALCSDGCVGWIVGVVFVVGDYRAACVALMLRSS